MRDVDTDALQLVAESIGVGNPATATQPVVFDDENLQQVLSVNQLVRRARGGINEGIAYMRAANTHAGAGALTTSWSPWTAAGTAGWDAMQERWAEGELDLYILGAYARRTSGTGGINRALLFIDALSTQTPLQSAGTGSQVTRWALASYNALEGEDLLTTDGRVWRPLGIRYPRTLEDPPQTTINWESNAAAAADFGVIIPVAFVPRALGQDAV